MLTRPRYSMKRPAHLSLVRCASRHLSSVSPWPMPSCALMICVVLWVTSGSVRAQDTEVDVLPTATALDDPASYGTGSLPDLSSDVTFVGGSPYASPGPSSSPATAPTQGG